MSRLAAIGPTALVTTALVAAAVGAARRESHGGLLAPGAQLVYESGGRASPPWVVDSVAIDTTIDGRASCARIVLRISPDRAAETRTTCVDGTTLLGRDAASGRWRPIRPLAANQSLRIARAAGGHVIYETGAVREEVVGDVRVPVLPTTVSTYDSTGAMVRRLRERYAIGLATATGGIFEIPDGRGGWTVQQEFRLAEARGLKR